MDPILLVALMLVPVSQPQAPRSKPAPPGLEVVVQDWNIVIPSLPATVDQAHAEYGTVAPQIERGLKDLEREVVRLRGNDLFKLGVPPSLRVKNQDAQAAQFFNKMLNDKDYTALRVAINRAWNDWQGCLLATGLATPEAGSKGAPYRLSAQDAAKLERRMAQMKKFAEDAIVDSLAEAKDLAAMEPGNPGGQHAALLMHGARREQEKGFLVVQNQKLVTDTKVPELALAWRPLAEYLQQCASALVDLDAAVLAGSNQDLLCLRLQAKVAFLERCRATLWFSQRVWTRMTSKADPLPLKAL